MLKGEELMLIWVLMDLFMEFEVSRISLQMYKRQDDLV